MSLTLFQFAADTGILVLIWLVQLIIYPSFVSMNIETLERWHPIYTQRMTFVVMPLMIAQAFLHFKELLLHQGLFPVIQISIVILMWLITFWLAVPLHKNLLESPLINSKKLINVNIFRTIGWTVIWLVSLFRVVYFVL